MQLDNTTKMTEEFVAFDLMMQTLYAYFGANYRGERVAAIWQHLKPCRIKTGEYPRLTETARQKLESMAGNLGQRLKEIYYQDVRSTAGLRTGYDPTEDYRYPVTNLQQGLAILRDKGEEPFNTFAKQTSMPLNDRARVRDTCNIRFPEMKRPLAAARTATPTQVGQTQIIKLAEHERRAE